MGFRVTNLRMMVVLPDVHPKVRLLHTMFPLLSFSSYGFILKLLEAATYY